MNTNEPRKFNKQALEIARELQNIDVTPLKKLEKEINRVQTEVKMELLAGALKLKKRAEEGDEVLNKLKDQGNAIIDQLARKKEEIMDRLRAAQPELQEIEFCMNIDKGIFTPYGKRGEAPSEKVKKQALRDTFGEDPFEEEDEEFTEEAKRATADLIKRLMEGEEGT